MPAGVLRFKAGPAATLLFAQRDAPTPDFPHGQGTGGVLYDLLCAHGGLASGLVGKKDVSGPFDACVEAGGAGSPFKDVAQLGQDRLEPVVFQLGFGVMGELGLFLGIEPLQPGEEGFSLGQGCCPARIVGQEVIQIVIGKQVLVAVDSVEIGGGLSGGVHIRSFSGDRSGEVSVQRLSCGRRLSPWSCGPRTQGSFVAPAEKRTLY